MKRVAAFIDAGYFWVQVCTVLSGKYTSRGAATLDYNALRAVMLEELKAQFVDCDLLRVYWYDGPGKNGKSAEHIAIEELDDFKLRLGTRNFVGNQKGVDGLIIADIISLTQQKAISHALLVTGDADIAPGIIAAQGMGLRAHLLSIGPAAATSPYLAAEADFKRSWNLPEVGRFAAPVVVPDAYIPPSAVAPTGTPTALIVASVPVAAPVAHCVDLPDIAKKAHSTLLMQKVASTLNTLTKTVPKLPPDVDKALLYNASQQLGRNLDDREKRELRLQFKLLL